MNNDDDDYDLRCLRFTPPPKWPILCRVGR